MSGYGGNAGSSLQQQRRGAGGGGSRSLFYRDLGIAPSTGRPASSSGRSSIGGGGGGAAESSPVAALWRDAMSGADPPPPPCFTLEDRFERSTPSEPMTGVEQHSYRSPTLMELSKSPPKTPLSSMSLDGGATAATPSSPFFPSPVVPSAATPAASPPSASWWSPLHQRNASSAEKVACGVVVPHQQSGLLTLPTPREIIRPGSSHRSLHPADQGEQGDEWVTIYGFPGEDTNAVLREFEKCGPILKHVSGPPNSNWLHVEYQFWQDAQKALLKNGMQLCGALIVGVKPVDPMQRQALLARDQRSPAFMIMPPKVSSATKNTAAAGLQAAGGPRPYYLHAGEAAVKSASTTIASPSKSILSKISDLVFGF